MEPCERHDWILVDAHHDAVGYYTYWVCTKCFAEQDDLPEKGPGLFSRFKNWILAIWRSYD